MLLNFKIISTYFLYNHLLMWRELEYYRAKAKLAKINW